MHSYSDIFIIGGGINGVALAADAAGRGLSVTLCEKNDLASGTSCKSSKLIHGGLRYLEYYEFGLVKKALQEREILLFRAPFLVKPLEFVLPHEKHLRPAWVIRLGLLLYDYLSKRPTLPRSKSINLKNDIRGKELIADLTFGFSYYDCFTDDSRLVILNALSAKEKGAQIFTRTEFVSAKRAHSKWIITIKNTLDGKLSIHQAKTLINVAGPWIKEVQKNIENADNNFNITLDKGSHIIIPKLYEGDFAYILQNSDKRIIFAIPYLDKYTLIGTTDEHFKNDLNNVSINLHEKNYLCDIINKYFKKSIHISDIIYSYSGVRCLQAQYGHSDAATTRDFKTIIDNKNDTTLITLIGGKLTTHRVLAEYVINQLKKYYPHMKPAWTGTQPLPGGDIAQQDFMQFINSIKLQYPWLPEPLALRYAKQYGTRIHHLLKDTHTIHDLGHDYSQGLYQKEVDYLKQYEWAMTAEDILWRRTKLGISFTNEAIKQLEQKLIMLN